jgi:hypothetical protein
LQLRLQQLQPAQLELQHLGNQLRHGPALASGGLNSSNRRGGPHL